MTSATRTLSLFASLRDGESRPGQGPRDAAAAPADAQLVALAREAPADALEAMYGAYKGRIYTYLLRLLADPEGADDLTQDVFTKAYQAFGTLTKEHRVLPWLYRIATNTGIDHLRRKRRFTWLRVGRLAGTGDEPVMRDHHGELPERDQVQGILARLPAEQSTALLLHALEGYSYKEIADRAIHPGGGHRQRQRPQRLGDGDPVSDLEPAISAGREVPFCSGLLSVVRLSIVARRKELEHRAA